MIYVIMDVFNNYSEFRPQKVFYDGWKSARNMAEAKRAAYISRVGIPEEQKKSDLKRAEAVLNSIDIMDDYSQARAEDMEVIAD